MYEKSSSVSYKTKHVFSKVVDHSHSLLFTQRNGKLTKPCMDIDNSFICDCQKWKQPRCPSVGEQINSSILLCERNQYQKAIFYLTPNTIKDILEKTKYRDGKKISGYQAGGKGEEMEQRDFFFWVY
jgi:hypothetical protein